MCLLLDHAENACAESIGTFTCTRASFIGFRAVVCMRRMLSMRKLCKRAHGSRFEPLWMMRGKNRVKQHLNRELGPGLLSTGASLDGSPELHEVGPTYRSSAAGLIISVY